MKLALKFTVAFLAGLCPLLAWYAFSVFQREIRLFQTDMRRDDKMMGQALAVAMKDIMQQSGEESAARLIDQANRNESGIRVRWVKPDKATNRLILPALPIEELKPLEDGKEVATIHRQTNGQNYLYTYVPVGVGREGRGALELTESLEEQDRYTRDTLIHIASVTGLIVMISGGLMLWLGFRIVGRPIRSLVAATERVAAGDFERRLSVRQQDELRELAEAFNQMCDQLAEAKRAVAAETAARMTATEQLRHADKLRTVGQLTSGVAHELGTPLNVVWGRAKMIANGEILDRDIASCARVIAEQSGRMATIIRQLLNFARPSTPHKSRVDLLQIARQTLTLLTPIAEKHDVALTMADSQGPMVAEVDADQLQQVVSNLVLNGIQSVPDGGELTVGARIEHVLPPAFHGGTPGSYACLYVQDDGVGIAEENLPRIFEPFFTTKDVGEGTGLGLSVSFGIIREHGGWIGVTSVVGEGSCFSIYLPPGDQTCAATC
jgi:signal transduction histidine kinase